MNTPVDKQSADHSSTRMEQRARSVFDQSTASLDAQIQSRLNQARQTALEAARGKNRVVLPRWLIPAGSVVAAALIAVVAFQYTHVEVNGQTTAAMEDMEIIASNEELDLLQDVDFYDSLDDVDSPDSEV